MHLQILIVDDEPLALRQMVAYVEKTPFLELAASCSNGFEALKALEEQNIDVVFADINMPELNGVDLIKSLTKAPLVVFTTAHAEYAIEGFKVEAVDYLLKPIAYSDFLNAANKCLARHQQIKPQVEEVRSTSDYLFIKSEYKLVRIKLSDITYIEGMREYVRIHLSDQKPIMTLLSMKSLEERLPAEEFMRVHRSYIVRTDQISTIERFRIFFPPDVYIPVSEQYKEAFQSYIDKHFL